MLRLPGIAGEVERFAGEMFGIIQDEVSLMQLVDEYPGTGSRFPYLLFQDDAGTFYKVLLRNRFLYVSTGTQTIERDGGELDIPFVGADRTPIGDFVYDNSEDANAAFERFRASPDDMAALARSGHKP